MCRGQWGEGERALKVVTWGRMVDVDGVGVEYVSAICCRGVDVHVEFAGVEGGVVVVADGEADGVRGRRM